MTNLCGCMHRCLGLHKWICMIPIDMSHIPINRYDVIHISYNKTHVPKNLWMHVKNTKYKKYFPFKKVAFLVFAVYKDTFQSINTLPATQLNADLHTQLSKKLVTKTSSLVLGNCGIPVIGINAALLSFRLPITWSIMKLKLSTSLGVSFGTLFWSILFIPVLCKGAAIADLQYRDLDPDT